MWFTNRDDGERKRLWSMRALRWSNIQTWTHKRVTMDGQTLSGHLTVLPTPSKISQQGRGAQTWIKMSLTQANKSHCPPYPAKVHRHLLCACGNRYYLTNHITEFCLWEPHKVRNACILSFFLVYFHLIYSSIRCVFVCF